MHVSSNYKLDIQIRTFPAKIKPAIFLPSRSEHGARHTAEEPTAAVDINFHTTFFARNTPRTKTCVQRLCELRLQSRNLVHAFSAKGNYSAKREVGGGGKKSGKVIRVKCGERLALRDETASARPGITSHGVPQLISGRGQI